MSEDQSLKECFRDAEISRKNLENVPSFTTETSQTLVASAVSKYQQCLKIADQVSLFSPNELLEDVSSGDLQYFLISFYLSEFLLRIINGDRKSTLHRARGESERFLKLLDSYDILSKDDARMYERYRQKPATFSTASVTDAAARRETKIARFREEKALKNKMEHLRQNPAALQNDDTALRDLHTTNIRLCTYQTFQSLEGIAQELDVLSMAPPAPPQGANISSHDERLRNDRNGDGYSERLDPSLSELLTRGKGGPILSKDGRPLRPFTLLDSRQRVQQGVFRPDHNLPTMSIDEYLEEEKKRGGIIEGGGPQSELRPEPDEDDLEKADAETMKARAWDEFQEDNPKGAGNTINRG